MKEISEDNRKHLDYLQSVITRMNTNSFQIKSFTVTIIAAMLAIFASTQKIVFIAISSIPTIMFWFIDTYYLQLERKYRGIYNDVIGITNTRNVETYDMSLEKYKGNGYSYSEVLFSKTIAPLYVITFLIIVTSSIILLINKLSFI
jgi:hypothetical protein